MEIKSGVQPFVAGAAAASMAASFPETAMSLLPDKARVRRIVFGTDTPAGRLFDLVLIWVILLSVLVAVVG